VALISDRARLERLLDGVAKVAAGAVVLYAVYRELTIKPTAVALRSVGGSNVGVDEPTREVASG